MLRLQCICHGRKPRLNYIGKKKHTFVREMLILISRPKVFHVKMSSTF